MRVLVVRVVHDPRDARIRVRQIRALSAAGHEVVLAAPFTDCGLADELHGDAAIDLPRAVGRSRLRALAAARRMLKSAADNFDVVILHDPELLLAIGGLTARSGAPGYVWDVHEDVTALADQRSWVPTPLAPVVRRLTMSMVRWAERRTTIILAENSYHHAFAGTHAIVPNAVPVPREFSGPMSRRVVYMGHITRQRGALEMIEAARLLGPRAEVHFIGHASADVTDEVRAAHESGDLTWHGFIANDKTGELIDGALAGLAVLHDLPNYRHALPTKLAEYGAYGIPCVVTPNPASVDFVSHHGAGVVVPFGDPQAIADAILRLGDSPADAAAMSAAARRTTEENFSWEAFSPRFLDVIEQASRKGPRSLT